MIYELTTLTAGAARLKELMEAVNTAAADCPAELVAAWFTEVGQVNDVLVLRRFEDSAAASEVKAGGDYWLQQALPLTTGLQVEQYRLLPNTPAPQAGKLGALHEMRTYTYRPGMLDEMIETWTPSLLQRMQVSPAPLVMYSIGGRATRFVHLWAYESFEDRLRIRAEQAAKGTWPPPGGRNRWLAQENAFLTPLACSPLKLA